MYAVSTPAHDVRFYEVYESRQPWYRPLPLEGVYVGVMTELPMWRNLKLSIHERFDDLWRIFMMNNIAHMEMWTGYHIEGDTIQGIDCYFQYWTPTTPVTNWWERYWLQDRMAPYVLHSRQWSVP